MLPIGQPLVRSEGRKGLTAVLFQAKVESINMCITRPRSRFHGGKFGALLCGVSKQLSSSGGLSAHSLRERAMPKKEKKCACHAALRTAEPTLRLSPHPTAWPTRVHTSSLAV